MPFYNFGNYERDFHDPGYHSPLYVFGDANDDHIYAVVNPVSDRNAHQRDLKRRRQTIANRRKAPRRGQRSVAERPQERAREYAAVPTATTPSEKWFAPRFDVRETMDSYYLHGELPGVEQSDVDIEFTDSQTLQVKGFVNRAYDAYNSVGDDTSSSSSSSSSSEEESESDDNTESSSESSGDEALRAFIAAFQPDTDSEADDSSSSDSSHASHQASVEDVDEDGNTISIRRAARPSSTTRAAADERSSDKKRDNTGWTYWLTERSVGTFKRTFQFPREVDQDNVKATLKQGILTVRVPKEVQKRTRRIEIE